MTTRKRVAWFVLGSMLLLPLLLAGYALMNMLGVVAMVTALALLSLLIWAAIEVCE